MRRDLDATNLYLYYPSKPDQKPIKLEPSSNSGEDKDNSSNPGSSLFLPTFTFACKHTSGQLLYFAVGTNNKSFYKIIVKEPPPGKEVGTFQAI